MTLTVSAIYFILYVASPGHLDPVLHVGPFDSMKQCFELAAGSIGALKAKGDTGDFRASCGPNGKGNVYSLDELMQKAGRGST